MTIQADTRTVKRLTTIMALIAAALLAAFGAAAPDSAQAKRAKVTKKSPQVKLVAPMRVRVGRPVTLRGTRFAASKRRNTVIFKGARGRVAFAKPRRAGKRKLVVKVPAKVERLLRKSAGKGVATRVRLRVISKRRYGRITSKRLSPVIVSAVRAGKTVQCGSGSDYDGDLISNTVERSIKTDPCNRDTDGDGVEDGFEYFSAKDLNQRPVPYPGKRPYPNPLDATDAGNDYDGDGLALRDEYQAWNHPYQPPAATALQYYSTSGAAPVFGGPYGGRPAFGNHSLPMNYSDGNQDTVGVRPGSLEFRSYLDTDGDGRLTDDERDADGDGLSNHNELYLLMAQGHYPDLETPAGCSYTYKAALPRPFPPVSFVDSDSDGDGVWDGNDDQDTDDVSNADEIKPPYKACGTPPAEVGPLPYGATRSAPTDTNVLRNPYNPCQPDPSSRTCRRYLPR